MACLFTLMPIAATQARHYSEQRAMMNMHECRFAIERELLERRVPVADWRMIPYPSDGRLIMACAELTDGNEIQMLFELETPIDMSRYDEWAKRQGRQIVCSGARNYRHRLC